MGDLEKYFKQVGANPFIGYTQSIIAVIDSQGNLIEWNTALDRLKSILPVTARIQDLLAETSRELFQLMIDSREIRQTHLQLLTHPEKSDCNCLITPLPGGKSLFFAEFMSSSRDDEISRLRFELEKTWRTLKVKQIELESVLVQSNEISHTDPLTFLPNRKEIIAELALEIIRSNRHRKPLTILMVDIDRFQEINDMHGQVTGDKVLRAAGCELLTCVRQIDKLGRYGGDEFLFILPSATQKAAQVVANRILDILRGLEIGLEHNRFIHITASIGIAQYRIDKEMAQDLIQRADEALAAAKRNGRSCWAISNPKKTA